MNERRICEEIDANRGGSVGFTLWEPIDPQPRCDNCDFLDKECRCLSWGVTKEILYIREPDKMFCPYWELKE